MIQLTNITKSFGIQELFSNLNFKMNPGSRVGLVGRNGSGKSTLFKIILGEEHADTGEVVVPKGYRIGALKQYLSFSEKTLRDEAALALSEDAQYDVYKVEKILFGLGFTLEDLDKDPLSFSGGYQIRINLAKLLVTEPNLLLLDEPTNYLDILSLRWLKAFLKSFQGEVILITHDRDFMDAITTHTMGIVRRNLSVIQGNTHKFYELLKSNEELHEKTKLAQDKKVKELEDFIARNKARASTAALAQSKVKQLEKMDILEDLGMDASLKFDFNYKETSAKLLLEVSGLSFGYTQDNVLFKDVSFQLERGQRIAIIGKNGKGKSTLLNTIAEELTPLSGTVEYHPSVTFAHFGQTNISRLNPENTIIEEVSSANLKLSTQTIRAICGGMMFSGDSADKKISLLSGGEKSRVMLGQILARNVNMLFLDEPTHHLDIDSIEALTQAITRFDGSVIIVSHSEELLRRVADRLIVFTSQGAVYFDGGYEEFLEKMGWEDEEVNEKPKQKPKINRKELKRLRAEIIDERSKTTNPLKKEIEKLEKVIMELEMSHMTPKIESEIEEKFETLSKLHEDLEKKLADYEERLAALEG